MKFSDLMPYLIAVIVPVISGLLSFFASTKKSKEDLRNIQEQNKHDLERLMNEHKLDLEGLEAKHRMEIEKIDLEHQHKIELMEKEMKGKFDNEVFGNMLMGILNSPEIKSKMSQSVLLELSKKEKGTE